MQSERRFGPKSFSNLQAWRLLILVLLQNSTYYIIYVYIILYICKNTIVIIGPCSTEPCGKNSICSVIDNGVRNCSCPEDFPRGDPLIGCYGKCTLYCIRISMNKNNNYLYKIGQNSLLIQYSAHFLNL